MPNKVRIISQRNSIKWDDIIQSLMDASAWEQEQTYFGIEDPDRADSIRRAFKTAGRHKGVAVKSYWKECAGCKEGGAACRYHVYYTIYDMDKARGYKTKQAAFLAKNR
jgi:hypothetical protein